MIRERDLILKRFMRKVDVKSDDECWPWIAGLFSNGYGQFRLGDRKVKAHRIAYFIRHGELPLFNKKGQPIFVLHKCDNPPCCNPRHLFLGTAKNNTEDAFKKRRRLPGEGNPNAFLTKEQVWQIRLMLFKRISHRKIAKCFNVSKSAITHISVGDTWSHLDEPTRVKLEV